MPRQDVSRDHVMSAMSAKIKHFLIKKLPAMFSIIVFVIGVTNRYGYGMLKVLVQVPVEPNVTVLTNTSAQYNTSWQSVAYILCVYEEGE